MIDTDLELLSCREQDAFGLVEAAVILDRSRDLAEDLALALQHNLDLWVCIRALVEGPNNALPGEIKENLARLSGFVSHTTFSSGVDLDEVALNALININLQIAEGLLEGRA